VRRRQGRRTYSTNAEGNAVKSLVIVADSSFVIETIGLALRDAAGLRILGKLDGRSSVRHAIATQQPDVVLVDEMQNPEEALHRVHECRSEAPHASILFLTVRMDEERVAQAIDAGVDACLSKSTHLPTLGVLIREIADHNIISAVPPSVRTAKFSGSAQDLTRREREILLFVADGMTNAQIGRELWVTEQTVKFHLSNIYRKLGVSNRTEASRFAHVSGLVRANGPRLAVA
jgi:DNA-binding NarL/FixJ family response regulator